MMTTRTAIAALMWAAGGSAAFAEELNRQGPYLCKGTVAATGSAQPSKSMAELRAITAWMENVRSDGADFAVWHRAQQKSLSCDTLSGGRYHRCTVQALPCIPPAEAGRPGSAAGGRNGSS